MGLGIKLMDDEEIMNMNPSAKTARY